MIIIAAYILHEEGWKRYEPQQRNETTNSQASFNVT